MMTQELHGEVRRSSSGSSTRMGLTVDVEVTDLEDGSLRVEIQGEEGEVLLRRKGEGLDALQHLVNTAYRRDLGGDQRIVVDAHGLPPRQGHELQQMTRFLMEKVEATGVPQEMGPLNSYARRVVHLEVGRRRRGRVREPGRRAGEARHHQPRKVRLSPAN